MRQPQGPPHQRVLKRQHHIAMRDPRIIIDRAKGLKPQAFIKPKRMHLCAEFGLRHTLNSAKSRHRSLDQRGPNPGPPRLAQNTNPANLANLALHQQPRRSNSRAIDQSQQMQSHIVKIIDLVRLGDALFLNEHHPAQMPAQRHIQRLDNLQSHAK